MPVDDFDQKVAAFLATEKVAVRGFRWRIKSPDYATASFRVETSEPGVIPRRGTVHLMAHRYRQPRKYSFTLNYCNQRVFALDVNPGRVHFNPQTLEQVGVTHWQKWPDLDAIGDPRNLGHRDWFTEFLKRSCIVYTKRCPPPPEGVQADFVG